MTELFTKQKKAAEEAAARARGDSVDYLVKDAPPEFGYQAVVRAGARRHIKPPGSSGGLA